MDSDIQETEAVERLLDFARDHGKLKGKGRPLLRTLIGRTLRDDPTAEADMVWEWKAGWAIEYVLEDVAFDEVSASVSLMSGLNNRMDRVRETFYTIEEIRSRLREIGEDEWANHVTFDGGEPVFEPDIEGLVDDALDSCGIEEFFQKVSRPSEGDELILARDLITPTSGPKLQLDVSEINTELVNWLACHPEKMREMNPRRFEELVAELFKDKGYEVELTPRSRDGGFDVRCFRRNDVGSCLTLVECKRYGAEQKVSVDVVRGLYGVVENERATRGIITTTSFFTKDAKSFQAKNEYRLHLADFDALSGWLCDYKAKFRK